MANSYIPKWQNISVNFNDANSMMDTAMGGISKAGTVFSKLRDDIAAEEQRAAEAAYKQQVFDENVRQFDLEQAWNRENAEAERRFKVEQAEIADRRARELVQLKHSLDNQVKNKNTAAYNALNTYFMDALKKTNDPVKAAEATRAFHNANYGNVLFDDNKIFGNLASTVTQGYSPENRFLRDITTVQEGATAGKELAGINKTLKDQYSNYAMSGNTVWQEDANGNVFPVPNTPERKQYLDLSNDQLRNAQIEQVAKDRLIALGLNPLEVNRVLSDIGSQSAIDQERAILTLASRNNVAKPENIPVAATYLKNADAVRANTAAEEKAAKDREKLYTPNAYNEAYLGVYDEARKDGKDIFNVSKNPELNASIELLSEAMRNAKRPASEFKTLLKRLKDHEYSVFSIKNDDITSKGLNNPVLKEARDKYLPNLGKPTVEKPETNKTGNSGVGNTNEERASNNDNAANTNNVITPSTTSTTNTSEDLKGSDVGLAQQLIKQLERQRRFLQHDIENLGTSDPQGTLKRIAYLDSAIANLQNKKAITVSDSEAYTYMKKLLDRTGIREVKANDAGDPIFTENIDLASRLLRLLETPSK